jgi:UDP-N-acetyl-2-amino-2-deoxyglucuronate dehydrogenase
MKTIALIGCGRISKRHIEAIKDNPSLKIAIVCDILEERAKETAALLGCPYTTDFHTIKDVDVASILTPSGLHPRHAAEVAESTNVPNIIVEKPISLTLREAYELFDRADKAGKRILPVYQNRYNPLVAAIKELITSGKLGTIYQFICNVLWNRNDAYYAIDWHGTQELDGGVLYTQASHYVDMLHFFFGEVQDYKGFGGSLRNLETYDTVSAVCRFKNGVIGTLNATVNAFPTNYRTEITILAEKGVIRLSGTNLNEIEHWTVEGVEKPNLDFSIDHQYGKGHNTLYKYVAEERFEMFPSRDDVLSGIRLMERLSY